MIKIKNLSNTEQNFTVGQKDGQPVIAVVKPGETKEVNIKATHPTVLAKVNARLIAIGDAIDTKPKPHAAPAKATSET